MSRNYPTTGLNQITSDPLVRWGCSYAEIMSGVVKGALYSLLPIFLILVLLPVSGMMKFGIVFIVFFITTLTIARLICFKIAKSRADKPQFYDKHQISKKQGAFIKPGTSYQRERN